MNRIDMAKYCVIHREVDGHGPSSLGKGRVRVWDSAQEMDVKR